ncbi:MAG: UDP-N-acetylmuramoyl-L-alanyl-D-glutamate--2,6-diaminopimelate ligase [Rhodocyclaceae bacterium]
MSAREALDILQRLHALGAELRGMSSDSRALQGGDLFAAWEGARVDGRRYIDAAVRGGAAAVVWDDAGGFQVGPLAVPGLPVSGLKELAGHLADAVFDRPSGKLWVAGVTGTNGKTTVSQWVAAALSELGECCGIVGTLGTGFPGALEEALNTTPGAIELHRSLASFVAQSATGVAMEVSSIGIEEGRVNGVAFDVAIFTNLSRDHLDYHGSMAAYGAAKARLFDMQALGHAVVNIDDAFGLELASRLAAQGPELIAYTRTDLMPGGLGEGRMLRARNVRMSPSGLKFSVEWRGERGELDVGLVAPFNVSNLLAVIGALLARGVALEDAMRVAAHLRPPAGRMQVVGGVCEPLVVIDYAHTPDALAKVLEALRPTTAMRGGSLVCVFGCGGDRDPGKRPLMGEVADALADRLIVTSDNPRSEEPQRIVEAVLAGAPRAEAVVDRAEAIFRAVGEAGADDVVVLAGKGHEPYQEIHGQRLPFSDIEQARAALAAWHRHQGESR